MDAGLFLAQFGHLADSFGGVGKLRNLILELAVRGQLVPQNPDDEPASDLLKRIEAEKARLVKAGEIRPSKPLPPISEDEILYDVPDSWVWVRLGSILTFEYGKPLNAKERDGSGKIPVYGSNGIVGFHDQYLINDIGIIIGRKGSSGAINVSKTAFWATDVTYYVLPPVALCFDYSVLLLKSLKLEDLSKGIKPGLNRNEAYLLMIALPPLAEQERIVVRVDELMALCDQLEAEQTERDHLRERATKSTLYHLTDAPTRAEARRYWHYAEQNFPHLFNRSATVADLRATILQLAVQGRLVRQNPDDERASDLLKRIEAERRDRWEYQTKVEYLAKGKNIPTDWRKKYKQPIAPDTSSLMSLPHNWAWRSLEQLAWDSSYGTSEKCDYNGAGSPVLRIPNISGKKLNLEDMKYTLKLTDWDEKSALESGDFLIIRTNGSSDLVGRGKLIRDKFREPHYYASYLIRFRFIDFGFIPEWIDLIWNSIYVRRWITHIAQTTAGQFNVNMTNLSKIPVPIPPTQERYQIVAKVNELMALCDQLQVAADERRTLSGRLFDSIVYHLFEGVG